ncbi:hypothetical protein HK103_004690 [Boothiomyces macroporosus]|uniref:peptidylprolyl isomerase n=1 Tax=Boothiomyces macroporosus TaxID=261099 RepID=A0AAD5UM90_9FUNG|nr:hypothetical protein HK103_004690 [Boothiomyces macroporosus]
MIQGGDITNGDGTGGSSIYGGEFDDENLTIKHDQSCLLSMANRGPNTNRSQFFVTSCPLPHLDGIHVVFGRIVEGEKVFREIESLPVDDNDCPYHPVVIVDCGEIVKKVEPVIVPEPVKKKVESDSESDNESEDEDMPDDQTEETNPYVIGVAPPEDCDPKFSFLDRDKGKGGRVYTGPRKFKDEQGRKIKGRGAVKYGVSSNRDRYRRSPERKSYRDRSRSPAKRKESRSPRRRSRSPRRHPVKRDRSPERTASPRQSRSRSPVKYSRSRDEKKGKYSRYRSPSRSVSPRRAKRDISPRRSPRRT